MSLLEIVIWVLRFALSGFFLFLSYRALSGDATVASDFARWGYPPAFRMLTGVLQALGAVALLIPGLATWGALLLVCVLLGAIATHLLHDPWSTAASPLAFLVLVGVSMLPTIWPWITSTPR